METVSMFCASEYMELPIIWYLCTRVLIAYSTVVLKLAFILIMLQKQEKIRCATVSEWLIVGIKLVGVACKLKNSFTIYGNH